MTRCRLADVIEEFSFNGKLSRKQIEMAVPLADCLDHGADPGELIDEAVDAGILRVRVGPDAYVDGPGVEVTPDRPVSFEVVGR